MILFCGTHKKPLMNFACTVLGLSIAFLIQGCASTGTGKPGGGALLAIVTPASATAVQNNSYSVQLSATGGTPPYVWSLRSGSLPAGISLDPTCILSGTPTSLGTFGFTIAVSDAAGGSASKSFTLAVAASGLTITTPGMANAVQSSFYRAQLNASGGNPPYLWLVSSGSLPSGVTMDNTGLISGIPGTSGSATFAVTVSDASGGSASKSFNISILAPGAFKLPAGYGWFNLDSTIVGAQTQPQARRSECPSPVPAGDQGCPLGVFSYSGAAYDTSRSRMIFWGGGHDDYLGNEVYEVNLRGTPKWTRLTNPSPNPNFGATCASGQQPSFETLSDGRPNARHSYSSLIYFPQTDQLVAAGTGALGCGGGVNGYYTWALDMSSVPSGQVTAAPSWRTLNTTTDQFFKVTTTVYDPVLQTFFVADNAAGGSASSLYRWNPGNNSYIRIASFGFSGTKQLTFPTNEDLMILPGKTLITHWQATGGPVWQLVDISNMTPGGTEQANSDAVLVPMDPSCADLDVNYPLSTTYDSVVGLPVAYPAKGNAIYYFNPSPVQTVAVGAAYGSVAPRKCLKISLGTSKWSAANPNGDYPPDATLAGYVTNVPVAYGRFAYVPEADVFMYLPDQSSPAWILRLDRTH